MKNESIILASSSPRRRELLREAGIDFEVVPPPVDEPKDEPRRPTPAGQAPRGQAEALAYFKARSVRREHPDRCVLAADTIVSVDGRILGKPDDAEHAKRMLEKLSGSRHAVITGVAVLGADSRRLIASETTYVRMRKMTAREIEQYIDSGEWIGKAGAYAIQETADRFIDGIEGSFTNVVGLPMELVARMFKQLGEQSTTSDI